MGRDRLLEPADRPVEVTIGDRVGRDEPDRLARMGDPRSPDRERDEAPELADEFVAVAGDDLDPFAGP